MASTLRDRLAAAEAQRDYLAGEVEQLGALVVDLRRQIEGLAATVDEDTVQLAGAETWLARATAAEDDLTAVRKALQAYLNKLADPERGGPVVYRRTVAEDVARILAA